MPADFEAMWRDLAPVGRSASSGGYFRQPFTTAERELDAWFTEQCKARGLEVERDRFGNTVAWWRPAGAAGPAVLTGSHLDSVLDGGAYDGPLGVVTALAAVDVLRDRGVTPARPVGVGVFVEEEGSRFGLACLGSRLATGATDWATARDLVDRDVAVGAASAIWPHGRYRFDFTGEANHAGTTRMEDRRDPMLTYAMTVLAANEQARLAGQRATFGRVDVRPNGTNAVPSAVTAWLDARAETPEHLDALLADVERVAQERAGLDRTGLVVTPESVSGAVHFDADLTRRIAEPHGWPVIPTMAGHDAGVLSAAGIPTAMLFVRNPTGVSHSPDEHAETADCLAGVEALADTLAGLAT